MSLDLKNNIVNRYKLVTFILFIFVITALAWQSDDAYHAYVMAKNLVLGNGFVYNIGERATASSCPLFTLVVALGYFFIRKMFIVSLLICIIFSGLAYFIVLKDFCHTKKQVIGAFLALTGSSCFISYTTSGLENSLLFFLTALFLKVYFSRDTYRTGELFKLAILVALIAMTRMDAVLLVVPMVVYAFLAKRENVSFIKAVGIGIGGLSPFILWELFSVFYYGFLVPNTAFVKLGTGIPEIEYIKRGVIYLAISGICDVLLIAIPAFTVLITLIVRKWNLLYLSAGIVLYLAYVIYIGGDFMLGRHFTVLFFMSVIGFLKMDSQDYYLDKKSAVIRTVAAIIVLVGFTLNMTDKDITSQLLYNAGASPIADERTGYFKYTSLYNNARSYFTTGELCLRDAWNEAGIDELREAGFSSGILKMVPGISIYYNSDMYLNDLYALGDPFLSKIPAVLEENWRIGHMWREAPEGYVDSVLFGDNVIKNEDISEYYEIIKLITRGDLFDGDRIQAIIDINMGKYDYLLENYVSTLDECHRQYAE